MWIRIATLTPANNLCGSEELMVRQQQMSGGLLQPLLFIFPACLQTGMQEHSFIFGQGFVAVDMSCAKELCYSALCLLS